jgi:hypothetical protein
MAASVVTPQRLQLSAAGEVVLSTLYQMQKEAEKLRGSTDPVMFPAGMIMTRVRERLTFIDEPARDKITVESLYGELSRNGLVTHMPMPRGFKSWGELDFEFGSGAYLLTNEGKKVAESKAQAKA